MRRAPLSLIVLLAGCPSSVDEEPPSSSPPTSPTVSILPVAPLTGDDLALEVTTPPTDVDGDLTGYVIAWERDGVPLEQGAALPTVPAERTAKGETYAVWVTAQDAAGNTSAPGFAEVVIGNTAPTPPEVVVTPPEPVAGDDLRCALEVSSADVDGDLITYTVAWRVDDDVFDAATTDQLEGDTVPGDFVEAGRTYGCTVVASDGEADSAGVYGSVLVGEGDLAVPDFDLPDVNPTSASFDQAVSPRDYLQKVSGWYFGHST